MNLDDKTPEQILAEVRAIEPAQEYLDAIDYLLDEPEADVVVAWESPIAMAREGGILFRFTGVGRFDMRSGGHLACGCVSQVHTGLAFAYPAFNSQIRLAIVRDDRVRRPDYDSTREDLFVFAQWQTWLDANVPGRRSAREVLDGTGPATVGE